MNQDFLRILPIALLLGLAAYVTFRKHRRKRDSLCFHCGLALTDETKVSTKVFGRYGAMSKEFACSSCAEQPPKKSALYQTLILLLLFWSLYNIHILSWGS